MKTFLQPLTAREEREYLRQYKEGDREARNVLISRNMRLVAHVIKKYQNSGYETEDLLSVGTIGLIKAVDSYNMEKGSRLATYAARCVENEVLMLFRAGKKFSKEVSIYDPIGTDRYGLFGSKEHTQREIAGQLGISRSYVSRLEKRAVEKLREEFQRDGYTA